MPPDRAGPELPEAAITAIYEHARAEFPRECCGYVIGEGPTARVVPCRNVQDRLHQIDPETHPRTAESAYSIGGRELLDLVRSFESDRPATVIYHSHPRVGAYFSAEDVRAAIAAGYPVDYLVVDAQEHEIVEAVLFRRTAGDQFVEIARFPGRR